MIPILILTSVLLSGCVSVKGDFCKTEKPKYFTKVEYDKWSRDTKEFVVSYNEYGQKTCGWKIKNV